MKALILAVLIITAMFTQTKVFYQKPDGIMLLRGTFEIAAMPEPNGFLCYGTLHQEHSCHPALHLPVVAIK